MKPFNRQQGIGLLAAIVIALVAAGAAAFLSSWYAADSIAHANRCTTDLLRMQHDENLYRQTVQSGSPDAALCNQINQDVDQYNQTCGEDFGTLPKLECP
ncbi:hypothetical protein [Bowmanella dokdonensis]|uniref:Uncharacterized protein n=1 Tax=Bowmanella dokdonensis TaxID=751969 RepID=A0A939IR32_9ALTE|nr:hypothetical protein [Bowmanella dokdonensis]MBN7825689.1 hypothetical protein [Bowmanella dokdonensis]